MQDFQGKLEKLKSRRQDLLTKSFSLNESFSRSNYNENTLYALEVMEPIDKNYTENTYKQVERVKNQLKPALKAYGIDVDFEFQGSVPTNTHIKLYSDIDLLTIHQKFFTLQYPLTPQFRYDGDIIADLKELRGKSFKILDTVFSACDIDNSGGKAIQISGGSLNRKIDIVACNWHNTPKYIETKDADYRGINILDNKNNTTLINYPFMHIYQINTKDLQVDGNEKRLIRLLKSIKVDADQEIKISSYDIASLVFRMDNSELRIPQINRLKLLNNCNFFLKRVIANFSFRNSLNVANDTRKIFCEEGAKVEDLIKLNQELESLIASITKELKYSFQTLENSYIIY